MVALFPFPGWGNNIFHVFVSYGSCHAATSSLLWCPEVKQKKQMESKLEKANVDHTAAIVRMLLRRDFCAAFFFCLSPQKSVISALLRTDKLIFFGYLVAKHYVFLITNQCNLCYECYVILRLAQVWSLPSPDRCPTSLTKFVCQIFAAHQVVWVHQSFFIEDRQLCKIMCQL